MLVQQNKEVQVALSPQITLFDDVLFKTTTKVCSPALSPYIIHAVPLKMTENPTNQSNDFF